MAWLPLNFDTPEKPEIVALSSRLCRTVEEVFARCVYVWIWVQQHTPDGSIPNGTLAMVDRAARMDGFGEAMQAVGWCCIDGAHLVFPQWDKYNDQNAKKRMQNSERQRKLRNAPPKKPVTPVSRPKRDTCSVSVLSGLEEGMQGENQTPFGRFWKVYPKRVAKKAAMKAWEANGCDAIAEQIIKKVKKWAKSEKWTANGGQYCPHPATWLNGQQWTDDDPPDPLAHLRRKVTLEEAREALTAPIPSHIKLEGEV